MILDYFRDECLREFGMKKKYITTISTLINIDVYYIINLILKKYGFLYLLNWIWWISLL